MGKADKPKKDNVTRNFVVGMVSLVLIVGVVVSFATNRSQSGAVTPALVEKSEGYGIVFNKELTGVPKIDIWEDFQCPVCRNFEVINAKQVTEWIDAKKATVVFHPLSFLGAESAYMANAAACAADEGKFLQYHEALYVNMASTENSGKWNPQSLVALGKQLGISSSKFEGCVNEGKYQDWVNNVAADGSQKNVNATPTIFINGKEIERINANYFDAKTFENLVFGK